MFADRPWERLTWGDIERVLQEEGIAYCFDHEGDREVLRLIDRNAAGPDLGDVAFSPNWSAAGDAEWIVEADPVHRLTTTSVVPRLVKVSARKQTKAPPTPRPRRSART